MALWDSITRFLALEGLDDKPIQTRSGLDAINRFPSLEDQIAALRGGNDRPWRMASINEALGVPAIYRCVQLISNTTGSLSMDGIRNGQEMRPEDRPRLIVRPDPTATARDFYSDTAWSMASRGEAWWYIAKRDADGNPLAMIVVPAREIRLDPNPDDRKRPIIHWLPRRDGGDIWPNDDFRQVILSKLDAGDLRGAGPLQVCGAAVSVAVEANEWAANFYAAGGYPSVWVKYAGDLSGSHELDEDGDPTGLSEVETFKAAWIQAAPNTPRVTDASIEDIKQFDVNPQASGMLDGRQFSKGDAADMFGVPGALVGWSAPGSSLTYQTIPSIYTDFVRSCLRPNYLEPIEQTMSDMLTRSTVGRFNTEPIEAPDVKTRYEVYGLGIDAGILTVKDAQAKEGIIPGDVENAPVPLFPPVSLPMNRTAEVIRCDGMRTRYIQGAPRVVPCGKNLGPGPFVGICERCKKVYEAA